MRASENPYPSNAPAQATSIEEELQQLRYQLNMLIGKTYWYEVPEASIRELLQPPVRQTVLSGPLDSSGNPDFGGTTGSATVTMTGTLVATAANGFDSVYGQKDVIGSGTDLSWTGLSTTGTMYLCVTILGGVLTTATTTLPPVYQWGGTPSVTLDQLTFNVQEMKGYLGDGTTANETNWVAVGEVNVTAGAVTDSITWYALMGRYTSADIAGTTFDVVATKTTFTHNLGVQFGVELRAMLVCQSAEYGWVQGEIAIDPMAYYSSGVYVTTQSPLGIDTRNVATFTTGAGGILINDKTTGISSGIMAANWNLRLTARRTW
jgi:hypothetical protein